jgi:hypothetical protein
MKPHSGTPSLGVIAMRIIRLFSFVLAILVAGYILFGLGLRKRSGEKYDPPDLRSQSVTSDGDIWAAELDQTNESMKVRPMSLRHSVSGDDSCKCYCEGKSWSPGATACMGGYKFRCVDRGSESKNCGWDPVKQGADQVPCDGGENCNPQSP